MLIISVCLFLSFSLVNALDITEDTNDNSVIGVNMEIPETPINYTLVNSNASNYWDTGDQGPLRNVGDILHNGLGNLNWASAGHTIDTDLDMNSNDITEVNDITIENDAQINDDLTVDGSFFLTENMEIWGAYYLKWLDNSATNTYAYIMASISEFRIASVGETDMKFYYGNLGSKLGATMDGATGEWNFTQNVDMNGELDMSEENITRIGFLKDSLDKPSIDVDNRILYAEDGEDIILDYYVLGRADFDDSNIYTTGNITTNLVTANISMNYLNSATYTTLQDWSDTTQSSGWTSGGDFTDNGDGSLNVSAGTGIIRTENNPLAPTYFFDWAENSSVPLIDDATNYIYIDINGGIPDVKATITKTDVNGRTAFFLGKVFREGTNLHLVKAGMSLSESTKNTLGYLTQIFGEVTRASGYTVAETGERYLTTTSGVLWAGLTRLTTTGIDTSDVGTSIETYYRDIGVGDWIEYDVSQINNSHWDDGTGTLNTLTSNRYGVYWIYGDADGHLMVVYGQGDYTLTLAEAAQPPSSLPNHVSEFGFLAAKIIVQEGEANFYSIASAYDIAFTPSGASVHNELGGLQGGDSNEYYHLDADQHGKYDTLLNQTDTNNFVTTGNVTAKTVNADVFHLNSIGASSCSGQANGTFCRNDSGLYYQSGV